MCPPMWAHCHHLANNLNLCFLRPTQVLNQNCKSIGLAIFAQLMAKCHQVHWRHLSNTIKIVHIGALWLFLANTIELVLPLAQPSPQPKRRFNRFSLFWTTHSRKSQYFTAGDPFPQSCPFSLGITVYPHLIRDSLGQSKPTIQTASRLVQPFLQGSLM